MLDTKESLIGRLLIGALAGGLILVTPPVLGAQQLIHGTVGRVDTGDRIGRVAVFLMGIDGAVYGAVVSDSAGRFEIDVPTSGTYTIRAQRIGYNPTLSATIHVPSNGTVQVRINLRPTAQMLEGVTVYGEVPVRTPELRDFAKRRRQHRGYNFDRADIERMRATQVTDVLQMVPTYRIRRTSGHDRTITLGLGCSPDVFIDGWRVPMGREDRWAIEDLQIESVYGIEVFTHKSEIPSQYMFSRAGRHACAVILVWTVAMR